MQRGDTMGGRSGGGVGCKAQVRIMESVIGQRGLI